MQTENPFVIDSSEAARRLGLSASTLAKMRLYGTGPAYSKLGRRVVYAPADIEAWVSANRFNSTSEYPGKHGSA